MQRNLQSLVANKFDILVIGGGIYGASLAWEAASRGLSVALIEKSDFASATSANSLKIIHGGFRYLQHADLRRMRVSIAERKALMKIAPHLIHPLPVLIPTYGYGLQGKQAMRLALLVNDVISFDRNASEDPQKHIPAGHILSRQECLEIAPGLIEKGLNGGAIFYDAQVYNSERLVLAYLRSAASRGAVIANYVRASRFLKKEDLVFGVRAVDELEGNEFDVCARLVINATGPWLNCLLNGVEPENQLVPAHLAKAINLVTRSLFEELAVGLIGDNGYQDPGSMVSKNNSFLFVAPWRGRSLIGTKYSAYQGSPEDMDVTQEDLQTLLDAVNQSYQASDLKLDDINFVHAGLLPALNRGSPVKLSNRYQIYDHRIEGIKGLLSVKGIKYTTARYVAEKVVDHIFDYIGYQPSPSTTSTQSLQGGNIERMNEFLWEAERSWPFKTDMKQVRSLIYNYGSDYPQLLKYLRKAPQETEFYSSSEALLYAQVLYGIHYEMAQKLSDVIFRRTELGTAGHPGDDKLEFAAHLMAGQLGWGEEHIREEIAEVEREYSW